MDHIDWLNEFSSKFGSDSQLNSLKAAHFHGCVQIHFADGIPHKSKIEREVRPLVAHDALYSTQISGGKR